MIRRFKLPLLFLPMMVALGLMAIPADLRANGLEFDRPVPSTEGENRCVTCHRRISFKEPAESYRVHLQVDEFHQASHEELACRTCHQDILKTPHRKNIDREVDCLSCHRRHPEFVFRDQAGDPVLQSGQPLSTSVTCGHCHDTAFIASTSDHADAGASVLYGETRPGQWKAGPGYYGGWDAIRYDADVLDENGNVQTEAWLKRYGKHHVGGGPADGLVEMNCLMCHTNIRDHGSRNDALHEGAFAWANSLPLAERGILLLDENGASWNPEAFQEDGSLRVGWLDIGNPDVSRCGQCHGLAAEDSEQELIAADAGWPDSVLAAARKTQRSGQIYAPHTLAQSGLPLTAKRADEESDRVLDVHAGSGLNCINCHYSLNHPVYYQNPDTETAAHLLFDPRRPDMDEYLHKPSHQFAKGQSILGLAAQNSVNSLKGCESCHDASASHDWLPFQSRHFSALACEACHVPDVIGPALMSIDWTMMDANGEPLRQYRGLDQTQQGAPVAGFTPVTLPRVDEDGKRRLAPFNMVVSWFWLAGDPPRPVNREELQAALLLDGGHHPDLVAGLDMDGDGLLTGSELRLETAERQQIVRLRLEEHGLWPLSVESDVSPFPINHNVVDGSQAIRECNSCHHRDSRLAAPYLLSDYLPGGQAPVAERHASLEYSGEVVYTEEGQIVGVPDASLSGYYVIGLDNVPLVDWAGLVIFVGVILGVTGHGLLRFIARRRRPHRELRLKRVHMYDMYDRIWHWLQAFAILALIVTGLIIHKPHLFSSVSFPWMVNVHNVIGFLLLFNAFLAMFYTFASGTIRRFIPERDFFGRAIAQTLYYTAGIFRGDPHPLEKTKENRLNPLQKVTYMMILNVLLPIQVITGLMIYWGQQNWPIYFTALGGLPVLAPVHTFVAWVFAAFIVMHVYLTTAGGHTPMAGIKSMITGWDEVEEHPEQRSENRDRDGEVDPNQLR